MTGSTPQPDRALLRAAGTVVALGSLCACLCTAACQASHRESGPAVADVSYRLGAMTPAPADSQTQHAPAQANPTHIITSQRSSPGTQPVNGSSLSEQQQRQLQVFRATVLSVSADIDLDTRRSAAQELIAMNVPEATAVLEQALRSQRAPLMQAAVSAMQSTPTPVPELMQPAIDALPGAPAVVLDSLAWAVARYGSAALKPVAALALDRQAGAANRLGPIHALSAFDSRDAAAALMQLLQNAEEPQEITSAALQGLQRLTGLSYGPDLQQWRGWWKQASVLPAEQWTAFITESLSKRAAQLQTDLQREQEVNERLARELFAAYRDLYPSLSTDEQLRRLPALLQNQLPPIREFALSRVSLLLRDSVQIPPDLQHLVAERVADDVPGLRTQAARLLYELNYEHAGPVIAARTQTETASQVLDVFLEVLAKRPCVEALEAVERLVLDATYGSRACEVIWQALLLVQAPPERLLSLQTAVRTAWISSRSIASARLLAWIGNDQDVSLLTDQLDAEDATLRAAVAEGFCERGLRQPLIDRASDPVVFPFAVKCLARGNIDLNSFRQLASWKPTDATYRSWSDGMIAMIAQLPAANLLAADDVLASGTHMDASLRVHVLTRAVGLGREELPAEQRTLAIARLLSLLIEHGQSARALTLLDPVTCEQPNVRVLCFTAAALSGEYDRAGELQPQASAWISLLTQIAQRDVQIAAALQAEIERRFEGTLTQTDQDALQQVSESIRDAASVSVFDPLGMNSMHQ